MRLYYHKTDGGAEYYCIKAVEGTAEGDMSSAVLRVDGGEIEVITRNTIKNNIKVILK